MQKIILEYNVVASPDILLQQKMKRSSHLTKVL